MTNTIRKTAEAILELPDDDEESLYNDLFIPGVNEHPIHITAAGLKALARAYLGAIRMRDNPELFAKTIVECDAISKAASTVLGARVRSAVGDAEKGT